MTAPVTETVGLHLRVTDASPTGLAPAATSASTKSNVRNFTSTPFQEVDCSVNPSVNYMQPGPRLSFGGISHINQGNVHLQLPSGFGFNTSQRSDSRGCRNGYPASCPTEVVTTNLTTYNISEQVPVQEGLTLTCHNIKLGSDYTCSMGFCHAGDKNTKNAMLLDDISANFPPGINAVMGPSGCGKTSLLSVLSRRKTQLSGSVMINGNNVPKNLSTFCGYSPQEDILNPGLTVREHLYFSSRLRRRDNLQENEQAEIVDDILASLRLRDCSERKVGFADTTAISGGERKRAAIGMELVAGPKILFLDEPTSSLDTTMSKHIMKILRELGDNGRTVVLTIHQPANCLFKMCDNLTLLSRTRLVYHGRASQALSYFTSLGFPHEPHYSPPDFFVDILFGKLSSSRRGKLTKSTPHPRRVNSVRQSGFSPMYWVTVGNERAGNPDQLEIPRSRPIIRITSDLQSPNSVNNNIIEDTISEWNRQGSLFVDSISCGYTTILDGTTKEGSKQHSDIAVWLAGEYKKSALGKHIERLCKTQNSLATNHSRLADFSDMRPSSTINESILLCRRSLKSSSRLCFVLALMNVMIGILFGTLYYHPQGNPKPLVQNRLGLFFYLSIHGIIVPSMITAKNFVTHEKLLFEHERSAGFYRVSSYCISRFVILVLARIFSAAFLSVTVYWMTGLDQNASAFFNFMFTAFTAGLASDSLCLLCVIGYQSFAVGKSIVMLYMALTSVFAGFLLNLDSTFPWLSWIKYVSISRYCYVGWVVGEFSTTCTTRNDLEQKETISGSTALNCERLEHSVLTEIVGNDKFLLEHPWTGKFALCLMSSLLLFFCYLRMRCNH